MKKFITLSILLVSFFLFNACDNSNDSSTDISIEGSGTIDEYVAEDILKAIHEEIIGEVDSLSSSGTFPSESFTCDSGSGTYSGSKSSTGDSISGSRTADFDFTFTDCSFEDLKISGSISYYYYSSWYMSGYTSNYSYNISLSGSSINVSDSVNNITDVISFSSSDDSSEHEFNATFNATSGTYSFNYWAW